MIAAYLIFEVDMKCFGSTDKIDGRHEIIAMVWYGRYNTIGIERERVLAC